MDCIAKLIDDQYPLKEITHTRIIARAVLLNEKDEVLLLHLLGDDDFGHRDYYETPGGGVEDNETLEEALLREIKEETGYICHIECPIGYIDDYYNLINRHNINNYFLARIDKKEEKMLQEYEKTIIESQAFYSINKAIELYENMNKAPLEILVQRRELPILLKVKEILSNK